MKRPLISTAVTKKVVKYKMHQRMRFVVTSAVLLILAAPRPSIAQEASPGEAKEWPTHHVAIFLGAANGVREEEGTEAGEPVRANAFAIGFDYERRFGMRWGVGALVEYAGGPLETTVLAPQLLIHPAEGLVLLVASGAERHGGVSRVLFRAGLQYEIELRHRFTVAPSLVVDFVGSEKTVVFGLSIGRGL